jgi:hypothetical protein
VSAFLRCVSLLHSSSSPLDLNFFFCCARFLKTAGAEVVDDTSNESACFRSSAFLLFLSSSTIQPPIEVDGVGTGGGGGGGTGTRDGGGGGTRDDIDDDLDDGSRTIPL